MHVCTMNDVIILRQYHSLSENPACVILSIFQFSFALFFNLFIYVAVEI